MDSDKTTTVESLKTYMAEFIQKRDWGQFHTPKNLSMALAAEAAELMEFFLWVESSSSADQLEKNRPAIEDEIADILAYLLAFCSRHKIDLTKAYVAKMEKNALKYPVDKAKGTSTKYTEL